MADSQGGGAGRGGMQQDICQRHPQYFSGNLGQQRIRLFAIRVSKDIKGAIFIEFDNGSTGLSAQLGIRSRDALERESYTNATAQASTLLPLFLPVQLFFDNFQAFRQTTTCEGWIARRAAGCFEQGVD